MRLPSMQVVAGGVAVLGLMGLGGFAMTSRPVPVRIAQPEHDVRVRVFGLGTVEAQVLSKVGFEVGAALVELKADHGDRVRRGDVLAVLQSGDQVAKLAKARAGWRLTRRPRSSRSLTTTRSSTASIACSCCATAGSTRRAA